MVLTVNARYVDLGFCWTSTLGTWIRGGVDSQRSVRGSGVVLKVNTRYVHLGVLEVKTRCVYLGWRRKKSTLGTWTWGFVESQHSVRGSGVVLKVNTRYVDLG